MIMDFCLDRAPFRLTILALSRPFYIIKNICVLPQLRIQNKKLNFQMGHHLKRRSPI